MNPVIDPFTRPAIADTVPLVTPGSWVQRPLMWIALTLLSAGALAMLIRGRRRRRGGVRDRQVGREAPEMVWREGGELAGPRLRHRTGQRPGHGRYRCELCSWVVQLDDDPEKIGTGPFVVTLDGETRSADAPLPPCLGCGGQDAPIFERVADEPPDASSAFSPDRRSGDTPTDQWGMSGSDDQRGEGTHR